LVFSKSSWYEGSQLVNGSILDYRLPRFSDLPKEIELHLVQNQDGVGPYGAKGGGEASLNSMAANIANAVDHSVGVRIRQAPLTPERVWRPARKNKKDKREIPRTAWLILHPWLMI
jgi:CO/xanthine dehydrogenase Mo-binding subunit